MSISVTKEQIKHFLFSYQHLTEKTQLKDSTKILEFVKKVGCIQYDPLNVVGRNADLVLQSRILDYNMNDIEEYLYNSRDLVDLWDKNMSICHVEDWPFFSRFRNEHKDWLDKYAEGIKIIKDYLWEHPYACSSDFDLEHRVDWHYGPQRFAKAALEAMTYSGITVVHHKKGTRRYYGLAERYIPKELLLKEDPNVTLEEYHEWAVLRRINSVGMLWNKPSDALLAIRGLRTSSHRSTAFSGLLKKNKITEVTVEGIKATFYIATENMLLLKKAIIDEDFVSENSKLVHILAPLDNLIWDRKLIKQIFDFDYKWEVYTPAAQRKYGYYVLPLTYGHDFIGRIELRIDKKQKQLIVENIWYENDIEPTSDMIKKLNDCLAKFSRYTRITNASESFL